MGSPGPEALILPLSLLSPGRREMATPSWGLGAQCPKEARVRECVQGGCTQSWDPAEWPESVPTALSRGEAGGQVWRAWPGSPAAHSWTP